MLTHKHTLRVEALVYIVYIYIYMHTYASICVCICISMHTYMSETTYTHAHMLACVCAHTHAHTWKHKDRLNLDTSNNLPAGWRRIFSHVLACRACSHRRARLRLLGLVLMMKEKGGVRKDK